MLLHMWNQVFVNFDHNIQIGTVRFCHAAGTRCRVFINVLGRLDAVPTAMLNQALLMALHGASAVRSSHPGVVGAAVTFMAAVASYQACNDRLLK